MKMMLYNLCLFLGLLSVIEAAYNGPSLLYETVHESTIKTTPNAESVANYSVLGCLAESSVLEAHTRQLSSYGNPSRNLVRNATGHALAWSYMKSQMESYGLDAVEEQIYQAQVWGSPNMKGPKGFANFTCDSLIASGECDPNQPWVVDMDGNRIVFNATTLVGRVTGSRYPNKVIVVGAHADTVQAGPGADDNGDGVAVVLEAARLLARSRPEYTIEFVAFDLEENGACRLMEDDPTDLVGTTYKGMCGSYKYVRDFAATGRTMIAAFIMDSVGIYSSAPNTDVWMNSSSGPNFSEQVRSVARSRRSSVRSWRTSTISFLSFLSNTPAWSCT